MKKLLPGFILLSLIRLIGWAQQPDQHQPFNSTQAWNTGELSSPLLLLYDNDGGISGVNSIPTFQCNNSLSPSVVIQNFGSNTLNSAVLQYSIDGNVPQMLEWEGALEPFFSDTILLPELSVSPGTHTLSVQVTEANGETDENELNDYSVQFNIVGLSDAAPYHEKFADPFLPDGYFIDNKNSGPSWLITDLYNTSDFANCIEMPFYFNDVDADEDFLYMKNLDLTNLSVVFLGFDVAYAYYSEFYFDKLRIEASIDCGGEWELLYEKSKNELATASETDIPFVPDAGQWRRELVDLTPYAGFDNVLIRFDAVSGHGNNLYIDNISVDENVGIDEAGDVMSAIVVYPNPANDLINIELPKTAGVTRKLSLFDAVGRNVYATETGNEQLIIKSGALPEGAYFIRVSDSSHGLAVAPVIISH